MSVNWRSPAAQSGAERIVMLSHDLDAVVDEGIYHIMYGLQPTLVDAVADLLRHGESPANIESAMRQRFGNTQTVRNVRHVADHLARQQ